MERRFLKSTNTQGELMFVEDRSWRVYNISSIFVFIISIILAYYCHQLRAQNVLLQDTILYLQNDTSTSISPSRDANKPKLSDINYVIAEEAQGANKTEMTDIEMLIISSNNATELRNALAEKYIDDWHVVVAYQGEYDMDVTYMYNVYNLTFRSGNLEIRIWKTSDPWNQFFGGAVLSSIGLIFLLLCLYGTFCN